MKASVELRLVCWWLAKPGVAVFACIIGTYFILLEKSESKKKIMMKNVCPFDYFLKMHRKKCENETKQLKMFGLWFSVGKLTHSSEDCKYIPNKI